MLAEQERSHFMRYDSYTPVWNELLLCGVAHIAVLSHHKSQQILDMQGGHNSFLAWLPFSWRSWPGRGQSYQLLQLELPGQAQPGASQLLTGVNMATMSPKDQSSEKQELLYSFSLQYLYRCL